MNSRSRSRPAFLWTRPARQSSQVADHRLRRVAVVLSKRDAHRREYDAQNEKVAQRPSRTTERLENMRKADHIREIIKDQLPDPDQVEEALVKIGSA